MLKRNRSAKPAEPAAQEPAGLGRIHQRCAPQPPSSGRRWHFRKAVRSAGFDAGGRFPIIRVSGNEEPAKTKSCELPVYSQQLTRIVCPGHERSTRLCRSPRKKIRCAAVSKSSPGAQGTVSSAALIASEAIRHRKWVIGVRCPTHKSVIGR